MKEHNILIALKYFGWWFAWGVFSAIMVLIVIKGGNMAFQNQFAMILGGGIIAGSSGIVWYFKRGRSATPNPHERGGDYELIRENDRIKIK